MDPKQTSLGHSTNTIDWWAAWEIKQGKTFIKRRRGTRSGCQNYTLGKNGRTPETNIVIDPCYNKPLPQHLNFPTAPKTFYARPIQILYALVYHLFTPKQVNQHKSEWDPKEPSLPAMPCREKLRKKKKKNWPNHNYHFFSFTAIICVFFSTYLYACYTMGAALWSWTYLFIHYDFQASPWLLSFHLNRHREVIKIVSSNASMIDSTIITLAVKKLSSYHLRRSTTASVRSNPRSTAALDHL